MMTFTVRELSSNDVELFPSLFKTYESLSAVGNLTIKNAKQVFARMQAQDTHVFVAVEDGEVIGVTSVMIEQKFARNGALAGHIEDVATRKGFMGKGVAFAVINACIEYAKERGCYKIILDCEDDLVPFYEKFGFSVHGAFMRLNIKK